eukprot:4302703-Lingulodinium_polyedra.AAC.1
MHPASPVASAVAHRLALLRGPRCFWPVGARAWRWEPCIVAFGLVREALWVLAGRAPVSAPRA